MVSAGLKSRKARDWRGRSTATLFRIGGSRSKAEIKAQKEA